MTAAAERGAPHCQTGGDMNEKLQSLLDLLARLAVLKLTQVLAIAPLGY